MRICKPAPGHIPMLRSLWKEVFGDEDAFLDLFFGTAFAHDRCLCAFEGESLAGMLYWLPCGNFAYLYAVATHPGHRGKGICRSLIDAAHRAIARQGFRGVLLYPQEEGLRAMYRKMGYLHETRIREFRCLPGGGAPALTQITAREYFGLRASLLPPDAAIQDSPYPELLESWQFYRGDGFLLAAVCRDNQLLAGEYLGPERMAPGLVAALGCEAGTFRCPGSEQPFAMFCPLAEQLSVPGYYAFPLD